MRRTRSTLILTYVNQYSCSTRFQFGTNLKTERKNDMGFTNHFWSILYFQINPTKNWSGPIQTCDPSFRIERSHLEFTSKCSFILILCYNTGSNSDMSVFGIRLLLCTSSAYILHQMQCTVPLRKSKLFISESCPILVLTTILSNLCRANTKNDTTIYQGPTTSRENAVRKYQNFPPHVFLNVLFDYDLNLCRCSNPELPPMRDFGSLYFFNHQPFVCGTLFPGIKLNLLYSWKQSSTYKSAILADI